MQLTPKSKKASEFWNYQIQSAMPRGESNIKDSADFNDKIKSVNLDFGTDLIDAAEKFALYPS